MKQSQGGGLTVAFAFEPELDLSTKSACTSPVGMRGDRRANSLGNDRDESGTSGFSAPASPLGGVGSRSGGARPKSALSSSLARLTLSRNASGRSSLEIERPALAPARVTQAELAHTIEDAGCPLRSMVVSPDCCALYCGGEDRSIRVWATGNGGAGAGAALLHTLADAHAGWVWVLVTDPSGTMLFSGSGDKTIRIWDLTAPRERTKSSGGAAPNSPGPGGQQGPPSPTRPRPPSRPRLVHTLIGHEESVCSLAVSPDSAFLYSGSDDRTIRVWDISGGLDCPPTLLQTIEAAHTAYVSSLQLSADGRTLFSAGMTGDTRIRMWRACGAATPATLDSPSGGGAGSPIVQGGTPAIGAAPPTMMPLAVMSAHTAGVYTMCLSPDGTLLYSGGEDRSIVVWRVDQAAGTATVARILEGAHERWVRSLRLAADGNTLFSCSADTTIGLWDVSTAGEPEGGAKLLQVLRRHTDRVRCVRISRDGRHLYTGSADRTIRVWLLK
ncbi:hypothetical protein FOA52_002374 [Chlamydomonas sp. UWO 241]|nr:hypothetical protein FOA52_002374 [Chlamydomonas sp. UWO 241]